MKKFPLLFLFVVFPVVIFAQPMVMIDSRLMLLAHPLFRSFNPATQRFDGTSSEPSFAGKTGLGEIENSIKVLNDQRTSLIKEFGLILSRTAKGEKAAVEKQFIEKRQLLEKQIDEVKRRLESAKQVPEKPGLTDGRSILPQVKKISGDLIAASWKIREKYRAETVIDISGLMPPGRLPVDDLLLIKNLHFNMWRDSQVVPPDLMKWVQNAKFFWGNHKHGFLPFLAGASDGRLDAVQAIQQISGGNR